MSSSSAETTDLREMRYTIDQLGQMSGMTVRNIRAHQARGLLAPPAVEGRTGYYNQDHLDRVRLILELQVEGLSLDAIRRILEATPEGEAGETPSMRRSLLEPWEEVPVTVTAEELLSRFGAQNAELIQRAQDLGILAYLGDNRFQVTSPSLLAAAEELVGFGLPLDAVMRVEERLSKAADRIARSFVELIEEEVLKPFVARGEPESEWPRVRDILDRTRPLAVRAAIANLRRAMTHAVESPVSRRIRSGRLDGDRGEDRSAPSR